MRILKSYEKWLRCLTVVITALCLPGCVTTGSGAMADLAVSLVTLPIMIVGAAIGAAIGVASGMG